MPVKLVRVRRERWSHRDHFDRLCRCLTPDVPIVRGGVCRSCGGLEMDERDYVVDYVFVAARPPERH